MRSFRILLAVAICLVFLTAFSSSSRGAIGVVDGFDTVVEKSKLIVEGQITSIANPKTGEVLVRVDRVFKGTAAKANDTLHVNSYFYAKPGKGFMDSKPLDVGDRLFLFLSPEPEETDRTGKPTIWWAGELKLIVGGHVADFEQDNTCGPMVAEIGVDASEPIAGPTAAQARQQIDQSVKAVAAFRMDLKSAIAAKDSQRLLALLRQRKAIDATQPGDADYLAVDVNSALAALHDYPALDEALRMGEGTSYGFATSDGLAYLLGKIKDTKLPSDQRILYIQALSGAGQMRPDHGTIVRPAHYLRNLATMAVANGKDRALAGALVSQLENWSGVSFLDDDANSDRLEAIAELKGLYDATEDVSMKQQIEWATCQVSDELYRKLGSPGGPVISVASLPDPRTSGKFAGRDFLANFSVDFWFGDRDYHTVTNQPILEGLDGVAHVATYDPHVGFDPYTSKPTSGNGGGFGFGCAIHPPDSLPAGKYQLYLRFYENGKLLGRSHAVAITLPK
jgi:hypothetical protein